MKKLFLFCLIAASAVVVSCSKEEEGGGSGSGSIVGVWQLFKEVRYEKEGNEWIITQEKEHSDVEWVLVLYPDGRMLEDYTNYDPNNWYNDKIYYVYKDNIFYLTEDKDDLSHGETYQVVSLTANELVMYETHENQSSRKEQYFKKLSNNP